MSKIKKASYRDFHDKYNLNKTDVFTNAAYHSIGEDRYDQAKKKANLMSSNEPFKRSTDVKNHSISPKPELSYRDKFSQKCNDESGLAVDNELRFKMAAPHNVKHIMYTQKRPRKNSKPKGLKSPIVS